jgi:diguanylate cyclase (GGDEF)-like protein/PAS domain S-box-containing protein
MPENNHITPSNLSSATLDAIYLKLSRNWSLWEEPLDVAINEILGHLVHTLHARRACVWVLNDHGSGLKLLNYFDGSVDGQHDYDELLFADLPTYFEALKDHRFIDAVDAYTDNRTRTLADKHLKNSDIDSLLHVALNIAGQLEGILCIEHAGGQRQWNEHEKHFAISIADLISQRLVHENIHQQEVFYRELSTLQQATLDAANYSIITTDTKGVIRAVNKAACRMLGYSRDEMINKLTPATFHDLDEVKQRAEQLSLELDKTVAPGFEVFVAMARRGIVEEREWTHIRKDGSQLPVLLSVTALHDDDGGISGFLGIAIDITDRVLTKRALREEERRHHLLFDSAADSIFLMRDDLFVDCNPATLTIFGCSKEQIINQTPYRYSPEYQPDGRSSQEKALEKITAAFSGETQIFEWQHLKYDGTAFDAEVTLNAIEIEGVAHLLATVRDISERRITEQKLKQSREELVAQNENLRLINELSSRLHGSLSIENIIKETLATLLSLTDTPHVAIYLLDELKTRLRLVGHHGFDEDTIKTGHTLLVKGSLSGLALEQGHMIVCEDFSNDSRLEKNIQKKLLATGMNSCAVIPLIYQGKALGSLNLIYDGRRMFSVDEQRTLEAIGKTMSLSLANAQHMKELEFMAHHDSLTGLPNRALLHEEFATNLENKTCDCAALLLIDLDRFKEINDTVGHHIGDKLLQQIGPRINDCTDGYQALVSRLGGDEFTVLVYNIAAISEIMQIAEHILKSIRQPYVIDSMILEADASIGISLYPSNGKDSHALLRSADVAMYEAKRRGAGILFYDRTDDIHTPDRLALTAELGSAIRDDQLLLHYQPKIDLSSNEITGFEALVRWQHPRLGLLFPDRFIPLAEVSDAIHNLTENVLEMALAQQQRWKQAGHQFSVAVNLSARNLIDNRCVNKLEQMLLHYQTDPGMLELEITETALMHDPKGAVTLLKKLSNLGVKLSIDDFGTGYSSLSYLRELPINTLKIDSIFVTDMLRSEQDKIIVRSTITLAHNLNLKVIAEGVEDEETMLSLKQMDCDMVQGYHISKPDNWPGIKDWLQSQ